MSDVHLEFHKDGGKSFAESLDPTGIDVLVLAGDITQGKRFVEQLGYLCKRYADALVLWVRGNHEYYMSGRGHVRRWTKEALTKYPNLRCLHMTTVEHDGQRFVGTSMWYPMTPQAEIMSLDWADFEYIKSLRSWIREENALETAFLNKEVKSTDVVITHFLPSWQSVVPRWKTSPTNSVFVCDMEKLIVEVQPKAWIHGHTHDSVDTMINNTRIVCNPFGYAGRDLNKGFQDRAVLSV